MARDGDDVDGDESRESFREKFARGFARKVGITPSEFYGENAGTPEWAQRLKSRPGAKQEWGGSEIRWGDKTQLFIPVPAASVVPVGNAEGLVQFVNIKERARTWSLDLNVQWENSELAPAPETVTALFGIKSGVGSATVDRFVTIAVNTTLSLNSLIIPVIPASTIYIAAAVSVVPTAGAARRYSVRVSANCAPVFRGDG